MVTSPGIDQSRFVVRGILLRIPLHICSLADMIADGNRTREVSVNFGRAETHELRTAGERSPTKITKRKAARASACLWSDGYDCHLPETAA